MKKWIFSFILVLTLLLCFVSCDKKSDEEIKFDETDVAINVGETKTLDFNQYQTCDDVFLLEGDSSIIKVNTDNTITGLKEGSTTLSIELYVGDESKTFNVKVNVTENRKCTISFTSDVESFKADPVIVTYGSDYKLEDMPLENYRFLGISKGKDIKYYLKTLENVTEDITLFVHYVKLKYTINFELDGGTYNDVVDYMESGDTLHLSTPSKTGYHFLGWTTSKDSSEYITDIVVKENLTLYAQFEIDHFAVNYDLNGGAFENGETVHYVDYNDYYTLPSPTKNGYEFLGWYDEAGNKVTMVKGTKNYNLKASYVIKVGDGGFVSLAQALEVASSGDIIYLASGVYESLEITKDVKIYGATYGKSPVKNTITENDTVVTGDILVKSSNVVLDGLTLKDKGCIKVSGASYDNLTFNNIYATAITYMSDTSGTFAPFIITGGNGNVISNVTIDNCKIDLTTGGRPMILYGYDIENLTITNSSFNGGTVKSNYNDGIKIENSANNSAVKFGIKGNLLISGNTFSDYFQYVIWLRQYADIDVKVLNNKFNNIGSTAASHAALNLIKYCGTENKVTVEENYNEITNGLLLLRIDNAPDTATAVARYNKLVDCTGTYIIKNSTYAKVLADHNYFNDFSADKMVGVQDYSNLYKTKEEVPTMGSETSMKYTIEYELSGGTWASQIQTVDETIEKLVKDLTTFYGQTITKDNVSTISESSSKKMYNFVKQASWTWFRDYVLACRAIMPGQADGVAYLNNDDNAYWRYEIWAFLNRDVRTTWPFSSDFTSEGSMDLYYQMAPKSEIKVGASSYVTGTEVKLETPVKTDYEFTGWYDLNGNKYEKIAFNETGDIKLYASWALAIKPEKVTVVNDFSEGIYHYDEVQVKLSFDPIDTYNQNVTFYSSNEKIFKVSSKGVITAISCGTALLKVKVEADSSLDFEVPITVYNKAHFVISYETNSYVEEGGTIKLNAEYILKDETHIADLIWDVDNTDIATVDDAGNVTGKKAGYVNVTCALRDNKDVKFTFFVTVLEPNRSSIMDLVINANNSNIFTSYNLGIGAGTPVYYRDIVGSVSKLLFNNEYVIDRTYEAVQAKVSFNHGGTMKSIEFITVHYTGNMNYNATGKANAEYFSGGNIGTSIHYVTGNDGIYSCLDDTLSGKHAGDSSNYGQPVITYSDTEFTWRPTGVKVTDYTNATPVWGISSDSYYMINGQKTSIALPEGSTAATKHVTGEADRWINNMGLPWKIVDGEYYMGTTWWCYTQVAEGRLCSKGGNSNSIGIESAVNINSDLWYTWQKTAQLVAHLMIQNNLDITRVVGHHFFSAKNCPQPMLENDMEIWYEFVEMVKAEYDLLTNHSSAKILMKIISGTASSDTDDNTNTMTIQNGQYTVIQHSGRVEEQENEQIIVYELTVTENGKTEKIRLASAVNSLYSH